MRSLEGGGTVIDSRSAGEGDIEISVVVPTYRRPDRITRLLAALERQTLGADRFEVLVVDDCSGDGTGEVLVDLATRSQLTLRLLTTTSNGGPAVARNIGWRAARSDLVAFVDDDCVPEPGWLAAGLAALTANERLGLVQGLTRRPAGAPPPGPWTVYREITWESPWFEGCNIFYRRAALAATTGFDEQLRWYGEDTAAGWAVVDAGWERDFSTQAVVTHDIEERGVRWRIRHGWLECNLVALAFRHPGLREEAFWRRWAFRAEGVALIAAVAAVATARRHPLALLGVAPYLRLRRLPLRRPGVVAGLVAIDAAQIAGHAAASVRHGRLVL
jgi:glycosyltransferase involved in cell wall biosynthesis